MEVRTTHRSIPVTESSQPSAARFASREAAERADFDEQDQYRAALVASEMATNLVKHAVGGEMLIRASRGEVELLSIDRGPGLPDVARSLVDGTSTAGTAGNGLGGIRRLADDFDMYSQVGRGTTVLARMRAKRGAALRPVFDVAGVSVPKSGETMCGDAWQVYHHADGAVVMIADGLGHGLKAAEAASMALSMVDPSRTLALPKVLQVMHGGMRHTRGAAVAIAELFPRLGVMKFAGVGNIAGIVTRVGTVRRTVSMNGTMGHEARRFTEFSYPWEADSTLVLYSDGLGSHWSLDDYPRLRHHSPAVVAATLYRDHSRGRDDVTVVVGRETRTLE
jgi:anti-sigma regulatory factor (Ser/Thr protein kinase)